jgi:hypothetical protein
MRGCDIGRVLQVHTAVNNKLLGNRILEITLIQFFRLISRWMCSKSVVGVALPRRGRFVPATGFEGVLIN